MFLAMKGFEETAAEYKRQQQWRHSLKKVGSPEQFFFTNEQ